MEMYALSRVLEDDVVITISGLLKLHLSVSLVNAFPEGNVVSVSLRSTVLMQNTVVMIV